MSSISILFGNPKKKIEKSVKPISQKGSEKIMAKKSKKKVVKKAAKKASPKKTVKKAAKKVHKVAKKVAPKKVKTTAKKHKKVAKKAPVQMSLPVVAPKKKIVRRKKARKVVSHVSAKPVKRAKRKASKKQAQHLAGFTAQKKNMGMALRHGFKVGQSAKKLHSYKKKGKYEMSIRKISNPKGVMRLMKNPIPYLNHNALELGGLVVGGFATGAINAFIDKKFPTIAAKLDGVFKNFSGSVVPLATGMIIGLLNEKFMKKNQYADAFAKGLIGAGVVGIGVTAANYVFPVTTTMKGLEDRGFGALKDQGFGSESQQMGEDDDRSYTIGMESDSEDNTIYPNEDRGYTEDSMESGETLN